MTFRAVTTMTLLLLAVGATAADRRADDGKRYQLREPSEKEIKRCATDYAGRLDKQSSLDWFIEELEKAPTSVTAREMLIGLGQAVNRRNAYDKVIREADRLIDRRRTESALLAGDLLFCTVEGAEMSSYDLSDRIKNLPDGLCEQAARLMEQNNLVVQAYGEWIIALRVRKQDGSTRDMAEMFMAQSRPPAWYAAWKARDAKYALADDYARQLIFLGRHREIGGTAYAVEDLARQMDRIFSAPGSRAHGTTRSAYEAELAKARKAAGGGAIDPAQIAYLKLRMAAREALMSARPEFPSEGIVFFTNPRIPGGVWNVNVAVTGRTNTPFGDIYRKTKPDPVAAAEPLIDKKTVGDGAVRGIDLHWEGDRLLFSYWHKPIDPKIRPYGWDTERNAHLYEMDMATGRLRQLTDTPGSNDIEPCFLPDGGYIFASDRSSYGNQCAGPFTQNKRCTTLYRLDPRRADVPIAISNNKDFDRHPHVLNDGTIVFLHWEYQERTFLQGQNAWRCRPDGTNMDAFYKQHISIPYSIRDVRQAEDSDICVATVQGHHDGHNGPIVVFNPSKGINNAATMLLVTPGCADIEGGLGPVRNQIVPEGGVANCGGSYINPYPMSDKAFLAGFDMTDSETDFGIYYIDVWGSRELLHRDRDMSAFQPYPLRRRKTPPVVADTIKPEQTYATAFVENVYRDLPGVEPGAVKYLRLSQRLMTPAPVEHKGGEWVMNHYHFLPGDSTARHFGYWNWAPTRTIGIVSVEPDGSAYFKVPAGSPVFLQALDKNYCEIRRMRTSFTLQRGEFRSCTGCHESRLETVGSQPAFPRATLEKGPQIPEPPPWGDTHALGFEDDIQPIFDRNCVSCHGERSPKGGLDFSARRIGGFNQAYRTLFGMKPSDPTIVNDLEIHYGLHPDARGEKFISDRAAQNRIASMQRGKFPGQLISISDRHSNSAITQPYQFGSNRSRLITTLLEDPKHRNLPAKIGREDWLKLVTWIDHNALYHSTVIDKSRWERGRKLVRVPVYVPSAWIPADLNPPFLNTVNADEKPSPDALKQVRP